MALHLHRKSQCIGKFTLKSVYEPALAARALGHGLALFLSRGMMAWLEALTALKQVSELAINSPSKVGHFRLPWGFGKVRKN